VPSLKVFAKFKSIWRSLAKNLLQKGDFKKSIAGGPSPHQDLSSHAIPLQARSNVMLRPSVIFLN
jgi:hypothetical protein